MRTRLVVFLTLLGSSLSAQVTVPRFAVVGNVRAADDARLSGAIVEIVGQRSPSRQTSTGSDGAFRFVDVDSGSITLRVRRVGFRPETLQVDVPQIDGGAVIVPLERVAQVMQRVVVRGEGRGALSVVMTPFLAFERRKAAGLGRFVTRTDIEKRNPQRTSDIFRSMAGVVLEQGDAGMLVPRFRNATSGPRQQPCQPFYWLDGSPLGGLALDLDAISPSAIEAIEVYSGIATVPPALRGPSSSAVCGVIAIWTRRGGPRVGPGRVSSTELAALVESGTVYTADQVDQPATVLPLTRFAPAYPDSLRKVPGHVIAEFIVDANGEIEVETIGFVSSTRPAFAESVRTALYELRFLPARRQGRGVRQVVQWPVSFEPEGATGALRAP